MMVTREKGSGGVVKGVKNIIMEGHWTSGDGHAVQCTNDVQQNCMVEIHIKLYTYINFSYKFQPV